MKRTLVVLMAMTFAGMAVSVQAADVTFNPGSVKVTVEPGSSAVANFVANAYSRGAYRLNLNVGSAVRPARGWLIPTTINLATTNGGASSSDVRLAVKVPANTPAGTYTALVSPQPLRGTTERVTSRGVTIVIEVPSQKKCDGVLNFKNVQVGPENIWAPKSKDVEIDISGTVVVAPGCKVKGTYSMEFNDNRIAGDLILDANGNFDQKITITVSKQGTEKEGKSYTGKLAVVDAEGNSVSQGFFVTVDHDRGKKKGLSKN